MNRHGETFEDRPPPGEYRLCPLPPCKWKLLVPNVSLLANTPFGAVVAIMEGEGPAEFVRRLSLEEVRRQEDLIKAHLKTHELVDFYTASSYAFARYRDEVARIEKLVQLVFEEAATEEESGEHQAAEVPTVSEDDQLLLGPRLHLLNREIMTFEEALACLKDGARMSRTYWGGGRYVVLMPGYPGGIEANGATADAHRLVPGTVVKVRPYFMAVTRDGELVPWTTKHTDLLAEDWYQVADEDVRHWSAG